jgi:hypothetical protein
MNKPVTAARIVASARCHFAPWHGAALGVSFRASSHAWTSFVAVARFNSKEAARRFSTVWAQRTAPGYCAVRSSEFGFLVSVPVPREAPEIGRGKASRRLAVVLTNHITAPY